MANLFEILGPTMVGPSSSHTAGACRLGLVARAILGSTPESARIELHGSFAMTGEGHGTKRAIVGGLLGFQADDTRIRDSLEHAEREGLICEFRLVDLGESVHPNTARIEVERDGETVELAGSSIGGGRIQIFELDGFPVSLTGALPTLVVLADDVPGTIAEITRMFADRELNLATVRVDRTGRGERALIMIEVDDRIPTELVDGLRDRRWVHWIRRVQKLD